MSITSDRDLPDVPTQKPFLSTAHEGTLSNISAGNLSNRPALATTPRLTGSCEKNTSAGLIAPSSSNVPAKAALFAYLTLLHFFYQVFLENLNLLVILLLLIS